MKLPPGRAVLLAFGAWLVSLYGPSISSAQSFKVMTWNVLSQFQQFPNSDKSWPDWVCRNYPHVVNHPLRRWTERRPYVQRVIDRESPDILALQEMRGDAAYGPDIIGDLTVFLNSRGYVAIPWGFASQNLCRQDSKNRAFWLCQYRGECTASMSAAECTECQALSGSCRESMSRNGCSSYSLANDHFSFRTHIFYKNSAFVLASGTHGLLELPITSRGMRRFGSFGRLISRATWKQVNVIAVHPDAHPADGNRAAALRINDLARELSQSAPVIVLGDMNFTDTWAAHWIIRGAASGQESPLAMVDVWRALHPQEKASSTISFSVGFDGSWPNGQSCKAWWHGDDVSDEIEVLNEYQDTGIRRPERLHPRYAQDGQGRIDMVFASAGLTATGAHVASFCFPPEPAPPVETFPVPAFSRVIDEPGNYCFFEQTSDIAHKEYIYPSDHKPVTATFAF